MPRRSPLISTFLSYLEVERGLSRNTISSYSHDLTKLQNWTSTSNRQLRALSHRDIELWIGHLSRQRISASTITRALSSTRSFYQFLVLDNYIDTDPTEDIQAPKKARPLPQVLSVSETLRLLASASDPTPEGLRDRALLELLYATGLRISEAVTLTHRDLALSEKVLRCHGKGNKERQVPMTRNSIAWLERYFGTQPPRTIRATTPVFLNNGSPLTRQFAWTMISHYAKKASLKRVTPHTLRHCFATHLLENGASTTEVQLLLGHSHLSTTEIYTHITPRFIRQSYDAHHPRARHT